VTVVRDDVFGVTGFDVYVTAGDVTGFIDALTSSAEVPSTQETAEALRIEAGRPRFTVDMDTQTIPLEAGIEDRAISLTKGCYVGQEVIVRVLHRGHGRVARKLVRLEVDGDRIPVNGDTVAATGQEVGRITSAAFSPGTNGPLALGYVQRTLPATEPRLRSEQGPILQATVRQLNGARRPPAGIQGLRTPRAQSAIPSQGGAGVPVRCHGKSGVRRCAPAYA
jgi:folate-binding protein YgfZ